MDRCPNPLITPFGLTKGRERIRAALFLDRDGVLVRDKNYIRTPDQLDLLPGVCRVLSSLQERWRLIVVTNQSGVARGFFSEQDIHLIHQRLMGMLEAEGCFLDAIYYCPHHPYAGRGENTTVCECRKPRPGMILEAAVRFSLDLAHSVMIGDSWRDIECGRLAGARTVFIGDPRTAPATGITPDHSLNSWSEILPLLQGEGGLRPTPD